MVAAIDIASRKVGAGQPCFIVAEAGVNHNGDVYLAHRLIDAAAEAGADAVAAISTKQKTLPPSLLDTIPNNSVNWSDKRFCDPFGGV